MKNKTSKVFAIVLSIAFVFCTFFSAVPVLALEHMRQNDALAAYAQDVLPQVLEFHRITEPNNVVIGNALPTYYVEGQSLYAAEYEAFPLFIDGTIYSIIRQYTAPNGVKSYSCRLDATNVANIDADIGALVYTEESVSVIDDLANILDNGVALTNKKNNITADTEVQFAEISPQGGVTLETLDFAKKSNLRYSDEGECPVDYVPNTSTSCCPDGLCWAACCASLANTFAGGSYTARSFHNSVDCDLYHQAYHTYMIIFLNDAGVLTSSSQYTSNLTYSTLKSYVNDDQVALLHLNSMSSNVGHYVIAYGYYTTDSGTKHFRYMDPNEGECTSQFPPSGTVYVAASGIGYAVHCYVKCY